MRPSDYTAAHFNRFGVDHLPDHLGIVVTQVSPGEMRARFTVTKQLMAPNGFLHAAAVVALADTACGYGCILSLPDGGIGFTTIELKTNFVRSTQQGTLTCEARLVHGGCTTQLWDATVTAPDGRAMAYFRCTQLVLR